MKPCDDNYPVLASDMERFAKKYVIDQRSGCWLWTASKHKQGYGVLNVAGKSRRAHRVAYQAFKGRCPGEFLVCHRCDNPSCVNPDHLFLGTQKQNVADAVRKGRAIRGERVAAGKLTESEVRKILSDTRPTREIANDFGVARQSVNAIKTRKSWRYLSRAAP